MKMGERLDSQGHFEVLGVKQPFLTEDQIRFKSVFNWSDKELCHLKKGYI
jgi:hypothetical protein